MGNFLAVTAFRTKSSEIVLDACTTYLNTHGINAEILPPTSMRNDRTDALVFMPMGGWSVVLWPSYFNVHDFPIVRSVSAATGLAASSIHVYDDDYWEHLFRLGSADLHLFCSRPHYWQGEADEEVERMLAYDSNPQNVCNALGLDVLSIEPYLVDTDTLQSSVKAFDDDVHSLDNFWVLIDFWRRLGITYPQQLDKNIVSILRLPADFSEKLPIT